MGPLGVLALPPAARALVLATSACAAAVLAWSVASVGTDPGPLRAAGVLIGAAVTSAALGGSLRKDRNTSTRLLTTDSCWSVAAAVLLPLPLVAPVALLVRLLVTSVATGVRWGHKLVFNLSVAALASAVAGFVAHLALPGPLEGIGARDGPVVVLALLGAGAAHLVVDRLVLLAVWLSEPSRTWKDVRTSPAVDDVEVSLVLLGALLGPLLAVHLSFAALAVPLPVVLHRLTGAGALWQAADRDAKTGLLNLAAWTSAAGRTLARTSGTGRHVAVIVADLDHFKLVNDRFGHLVGDAVLLRTAETLRNGLRPDSLLARFGGEEFVVLLPDADEDVARRTAERLRAAVEGQRSPTADGGLHVTASFGVAWGSGTSLTELLAAADEALYAAKRAGRNRVAVMGAASTGAG